MVTKIIAIVVTGFFLNCIPHNQEKELTVTLPLSSWELILQVIDDSKDHQKVKAAQSLIIPQLNRQLSDTTKPKK